MLKRPKISIVIPSFNQGQFLQEAIESVLGQSYPDLELFVVDGGSTDNSVKIIEKYKKKIDWWISEKDKGQSDAIIKGFSRAKGDLIAWLNSDDVYFPGSFNRVAEVYTKNPDASMYTGGVALGAHGNGGIIKCSYPPHPVIWFKRNGVFFVGQMATFFSRKSYGLTDGINISLTQIMDRDIFYKLINVNRKVCIIPGMVGFIRFHEDAKSSKKFVANPAVRMHEIDEFFKRNNISVTTFKTLTIIHKFLRFITLNYLFSILATNKYRNRMMNEIWKDCIVNDRK